MLTDLAIENFQSLRKLRIKLGQFTVVTGPTSAGKSALIRALRLVTFNARGTSYITQGEKSCLVGLACEDEGWVTTIARGARGQDRYQIAVPGSEPEVFTKLGGKVPDEVSKLLGLGPINFAGQFDGPYLLDGDDTGGKVARTLGELTNVILIFEAAREAGRRKKELSVQLKVALADLAQLQAKLPRFAGLRGRVDAVTQAETALAACGGIQAQADRLDALTGLLDAAEMEAARRVDPIPLPDFQAVDAQWASIKTLAQLAMGLENAEHDADENDSGADAWGTIQREREGDIQALLAEAGVCPTCGQAVHADPH